MSADRDRGIRRQKQKRAKALKRHDRAQREAAKPAGASPMAGTPNASASQVG